MAASPPASPAAHRQAGLGHMPDLVGHARGYTPLEVVGPFLGQNSSHSSGQEPVSVDRLAAAVLAELHDEWQVFDRRYLSEGSMAELFTDKPTPQQQIPAQAEPNELD